MRINLIDNSSKVSVWNEDDHRSVCVTPRELTEQLCNGIQIDGFTCPELALANELVSVSISNQNICLAMFIERLL